MEEVEILGSERLLIVGVWHRVRRCISRTLCLLSMMLLMLILMVVVMVVVVVLLASMSRRGSRHTRMVVEGLDMQASTRDHDLTNDRQCLGIRDVKVLELALAQESIEARGREEDRHHEREARRRLRVATDILLGYPFGIEHEVLLQERVEMVQEAALADAVATEQQHVVRGSEQLDRTEIDLALGHQLVVLERALGSIAAPWLVDLVGEVGRQYTMTYGLERVELVDMDRATITVRWRDGDAVAQRRRMSQLYRGHRCLDAFYRDHQDQQHHQPHHQHQDEMLVLLLIIVDST